MTIEEIKKILFTDDEEIDDETIELFNRVYKIGDRMYYNSKKLGELIDIGMSVSLSNEKLIYHVERDFKNQIEIEKNSRGKIVKVIKNKNLLYNAEVLNRIEILKEKKDVFRDEAGIEKNDKELIIIHNHQYFRDYQLLKETSEKDYKEIIKDYKEHFKELDEVLKWVVACSFTKDRRESFLHMVVLPGFGKSFFLGALKELGLFHEMKYEDFRSPCGQRVESFRNKLGFAIDEFTIFKKDFKNTTHNLTLEPKFGYMTDVEVYAKLFLSAEDSDSFTQTATEQITDRVNVLDKRDVTMKLINRVMYKKHTASKYFNAVCFYINDVIKTEFEKYIELGKIESDREASKKLKEFYEIHKIKDIIKIENFMKHKIVMKMDELLNIESVAYLTKQDRELKELVKKIDGKIYILKPSVFFDLFLLTEDRSTQSKAKYLNINVILEKDTTRKRVEKSLMYVIEFDEDEIKKIIGELDEKKIEVIVKDKDDKVIKKEMIDKKPKSRTIEDIEKEIASGVFNDDELLF